MKQYMFLVIFLYLLISYASEDLINTNYQDWELSVFIGSCDSTLYHNVAVTKQQTDTAQVYPIMFKLPDKNNSEELMDAYNYTRQYGNIPYFANDNNSDGLMQTAVKHYFKTMFKRDIKKLNIIVNPDNPTTGQWIVEPTACNDLWDDFSYEIYHKFGYAYWDSINDNSQKRAVMLMLPIFDYNKPHGFVTNSYNVSLPSLFIGVQYRPEALNETNAVICHEIGHLILNYSDIEKYNSYTDTKDGEIISKTFNAAWPYDLMSAIGGGYCSQYQLYGIGPVNTNDLLNTSPNILTAKNIVPNSYSNKTKVRLKSIREPLVSTDSCNVVILPIENIDFAESTMPTAKKVENQKFIIEYRNGKGYENCSPVDMDGECKGIFIQHIIDDKSFARIIDIECATALPEGARNSEDIPDSLSDYRGKWFFGKKINDWMDDIVYNQKDSLKGGRSAWWRAPTSAKYQSLPSDFFNDTDRNKFTPSTRPSTRSWKDNETNIAIFIDKIDGDYADLRIYRNYHSTPLTSTNAKSLPDGTKGLTISGDGYIGENFSVGEGTKLSLGDGQTGQVTLIPNTNMLVKNTGHLILREEGNLILENSTLNFVDNSTFLPYNDAHISFYNSNLIFEDGSIVFDDWAYNYFISVTGVSSFYNSNFDMIGASVLTVNKGSRFTLLRGSKIRMSELSSFTLKAGATLVLEDGAELEIANGAVITLEAGSNIVVNGSAKFSGNIGLVSSAITVSENSILTLGGGSVLIPNLYELTKLTINKNSEIIVENLAECTITSSSKITVGSDSQITTFGQLFVTGTLDLRTTIPDADSFESDKSSSTWRGIYAGAGSLLTMTYVDISKAETAVSGAPYSAIIVACNITECTNGIELINCNKFSVTRNNLTGLNKGVGVSLISSNGNFIRNIITGYKHGTAVTLCPPYLIMNELKNNTDYGLYVTGYNALPILVNPKGAEGETNNVIYNNAVDKLHYQGGQIYMKYSSGIYMNYGFNNVYTGEQGTIPNVPVIRGVDPQSLIKVDLPFRVFVEAKGNYWGYPAIDASNIAIFFDLWKMDLPLEGYTLLYSPYLKSPSDGSAPDYSTTEPVTPVSKILTSAMRLETDGKYKPSIKLYEQIIKRYEDTPEYYVAMARLPYVYLNEDLSTDPLLNTYDEALESESTTNKKFFKEMKISTNIKSKNYIEAIALAEEMKITAQSDDEILLADLNIAIAQMMLAAEGKRKQDGDYHDSVGKIFAKLSGTDMVVEPVQLTGTTDEAVLPEKNELFQNYPNPFNPVTSINFALSKVSEVKLSVYNISGQVVAELVNGTKQAGLHSVDFDGSKLNSGVYYYTLQADGKTMTKKMVLTK